MSWTADSLFCLFFCFFRHQSHLIHKHLKWTEGAEINSDFRTNTLGRLIYGMIRRDGELLPLTDMCICQHHSCSLFIIENNPFTFPDVSLPLFSLSPLHCPVSYFLHLREKVQMIEAKPRATTAWPQVFHSSPSFWKYSCHSIFGHPWLSPQNCKVL